MPDLSPATLADTHWKHIAENTSDGIWEWDLATGTHQTWGAVVDRLGYGQGRASVSFDEWVARVHPGDRERVRQALIRHLKGDDSAIQVEYRLRDPHGREHWVQIRGMVTSHDDQGRAARMAGAIQDITPRKRAEQFEQFRSRILEMLASNHPLHALLEAVAKGVESLEPRMLCSIHLIDLNTLSLAQGASPSLPAFYCEAIDGVHIGPNVGSCGAAAFLRQRVIVPDMLNHPNWAPYRELVERAGLAACWSVPIISADGTLLGTFGVYDRQIHTPSADEIRLIDQVTHLASLAIQRRLADERLHLAASVFTHAREGILITDEHAQIIDVNEAFTRITGYTREEVLGYNPRILKSGRQDPEFYRQMWDDLLTKGHWQGEVWNRRKNGEHYAEMKTISAVRDEQGKIRQYVALFADITALKEHESQLEFNAHHDALTGLPNRVLLADRLQQAMGHARRRESRLAVVYMDLDGFKDVNDQYGHEVGDQLLMTLADRMRHTLRESDTLARLGGDEFVAVLPDLSDGLGTIPLLQRLMNGASQPIEVGGQSLQVTASVGVTIYPQNDEVDADQLLRQADQAMYQAKLAGKNRFHYFDADQDRNVRGHHESLAAIRHALAREEFVLFYQPKVNMRTGDVVGAEALIRWRHPERGLLPPGVFLPVIENHPLAIEVGEWVINTALTQMDTWRAQGLRIPVSVNLGARQLQHPDFAERLRYLLSLHPDTQHGDLEMEVLETSALGDLARVSQVIQTCRDMGVSFALDDFGSGYSSLTYLKRLPVALLKIDQSFVRDMLDDPDDLAILEGVLGLSKAFRRQVIAEGVETLEHGEMLLYLGCDLAQGYGIARPMPADKLPQWVQSWRPASTWRDLPLFHPADAPLMVAALNHRTWVEGVEQYLQGARDQAPQLHAQQCCFGTWLQSEVNASDAVAPWEPILQSHERIHRLAEQLCDMKARGEVEGALQRIPELRTLRDRLLAQLKVHMTHESSGLTSVCTLA